MTPCAACGCEDDDHEQRPVRSPWCPCTKCSCPDWVHPIFLWDVPNRLLHLLAFLALQPIRLLVRLVGHVVGFLS